MHSERAPSRYRDADTDPMTTGFLQKFFGSRNQRLVKQYQKTVAAINAFEPTIEQYTDKQLRAKTDEFRQRVASGESLDRLLPEAFAVCREASKRVLKMRHFDVQLIGGMVLHYGKIAEMRTGEGKTLVATLAAYLNALSGRGVHVVTVNDYLAQRDAEWMGKLYNFLGLSWGINLSPLIEQQIGEEKADGTGVEKVATTRSTKKRVRFSSLNKVTKRPSACWPS